MIGLVNAIGKSENARTAAVERVLDGAIETPDFTEAQDERALPGEQESDRFDQAEHEAAAGSTGIELDVTA